MKKLNKLKKCFQLRKDEGLIDNRLDFDKAHLKDNLGTPFLVWEKGACGNSLTHVIPINFFARMPIDVLVYKGVDYDHAVNWPDFEIRNL